MTLLEGFLIGAGIIAGLIFVGGLSCDLFVYWWRER